jgi:hypothetical protein
MRLDIPDSLAPRFYPSQSIHQKGIEAHFGRKKRQWHSRMASNEAATPLPSTNSAMKKMSV